VYQVCVHRDTILRLVYPDCPDYLEREVRNDIILGVADPYAPGALPVLTGSQAVRHHDEKRDYHRLLRMHHNPSVCAGYIPHKLGSQCSRYVVQSAVDRSAVITDPGYIGNEAQRPPPIHLTAYQLCVFARHRKVEVAYTAMSLIYGHPFLPKNYLHSLTSQ